MKLKDEDIVNYYNKIEKYFDSEESKIAFNYFKSNSYSDVIFMLKVVGEFYKDVVFVLKHIQEVFKYFLDIEILERIKKCPKIGERKEYKILQNIHYKVKKTLDAIRDIYYILNEFDKIMEVRSKSILDFLIFDSDVHQILKSHKDLVVRKYSASLLLNEDFQKSSKEKRIQTIFNVKLMLLKEFEFDKIFEDFIKDKLLIDRVFQNNKTDLLKINQLENKIRGLYDQKYKN